MKTQIMFFVILALGFVACDNSADFALPADQEGLAAVQSNIIPVGDDVQGLVTCMTVQSTHTLMGVGRLSGSNYSGFSGPFGTYYITASGSAISDPLKDGNSILRMQYSASGMVSGTLTTKYNNGAALDQKFEGQAQRQINGKTMTLTLPLNSALLSMDGGLSTLSAGSVTILLPTYPMGSFQLNIDTKGMYCTED